MPGELSRAHVGQRVDRTNKEREKLIYREIQSLYKATFVFVPVLSSGGKVIGAYYGALTHSGLHHGHRFITRAAQSSMQHASPIVGHTSSQIYTQAEIFVKGKTCLPFPGLS